MLILVLLYMFPQAFDYLRYSLSYFLTVHLLNYPPSSIFYILLDNMFFLIWGLCIGKLILWAQSSCFAEYLDLCGSIIIIIRRKKAQISLTHTKMPSNNLWWTFEDHYKLWLTWLSGAKMCVDNKFLIQDWQQAPSFLALKYCHQKNVFIECTNLQV